MQPLTNIRIFRVRLAVLLLAAYWLLIFTGTHLPTLPAIGEGFSDKTKHFLAFFGLGLLLCYVSTRPPSFQRFATVAVIAIVYGVVDELTQKLVPGRHCDPYDMLADAAGALTAIALYAAASVTYHRFARRQRSQPGSAEPGPGAATVSGGSATGSGGAATGADSERPAC